MTYLMTAEAFIAIAFAIATKHKTCYMLGPWGWPATDKMISRATTNGSNASTNRQWLRFANAIKGKGFIFDCVGLIKGILWGWNANLSKSYGGAGYACNGVPDIDAKQMINRCNGVSTNFTKILPGEAVWMDGHIGIYIGDGKVVEATPRWNNGVQISTCTNVSKKQIAGTVGSRTWTKHGKLPWVDYSVFENVQTSKPAQPTTPSKEDDNVVRYKTKNDIPTGSHFRDIIDDLMTAGIIGGDGSDPNGNNDVIDLSHDMVRMMAFMYRSGTFDAALNKCGVGHRW